MSCHKPRPEQTEDAPQPGEMNSYQGATSAPVPISGLSQDEMPDMEDGAGTDAGPEGHASSAPPSNWRNLASLSLSVLSGDTIWHQPREERNR